MDRAVPRLSGMRIGRTQSVLGVLGAALAVGMVPACSGSESGSGRSAVAPSYQDNEASAMDKGSAGSPPVAADQRSSGGQSDTAGGRPDTPATERKLVRTARLELTAVDVKDAALRARNIATSGGGFAGNEETRENSASLTLRVPADRMGTVLHQLAGIGEVTLREESADDVTEQIVDVESRLANQRESVERVRGLLARAATVGEIVQIEAELTSREAELESLQARREALAGQVDLATVTLYVTKRSASPSPVDSSTGFLDGLAAGWDALLVTLSGLLTAIGAMLPFLAAIGIPAGLVFLLWRRAKRARVAAETPPSTP